MHKSCLRIGWHRFRRLVIATLLVGLLAKCGVADPPPANVGTKPPDKRLPLPGETFTVKDRAAFLILPKSEHRSAVTPWVWYAPTLPGLPGDEEKWMFEKFVQVGFAIAGIDVEESFGNRPGRDAYSALYEHLVHERGLSKRACLLARSRGGLMLYNWAADHPTSVACIAGIYPVCNPESYPGRKIAGKAYGLSEEPLANRLADYNPIERLEPLAKARVPIFHIHGDSDQVVPLESNSAELARRYQKLGGQITLKVVEGQGHNMWSGWFQCQELVDFMIAHGDGNDEAR